METSGRKAVTQLAGKRVVVMGLGRHGGGVGVARFLVNQGADVLVTDLSAPEALTDAVKSLADLPIDYRLGEHNVSDFTTADLIVVNPAVSPHARGGNRFLRAAEAAGVPTTSEIRLLIERLPCRERTIGITGTSGKSTVTAMIGHILGRTAGEGDVHVGGNLGGSLLERVDAIAPEDWVVLELSSFMLDGIVPVGWSPHIALVTNLSPNHLDWHGSYESYAAAKRVILAHQGPGDVALLDASVRAWKTAPGVERTLIEPPDETLCPLPGSHNQTNAAFAIAACHAAGIEPNAAREALTDFTGLPHRLQKVCERGGVSYFNDSKATTPGATLLALESFPPGCVHLIIGGYDKGSDLKPLAAFASAHCQVIYTIGATGDAFADVAQAGDARVERCGTLDQAMARTVHLVRRGDVVLLSPACASWDQFASFEERGRAFGELALRCTGEGAPPPSGHR